MHSSVGESWNRAIAHSPFAALKPGEAPTSGALWAALGKTRGVIEALLPGVGFLVVYTLTQDLIWSLSAPATVAAGFILVRLVMRSPVLSAVAGMIGILASAGVALLSGRAEDNFVLGFIVNGLWIVGLLISLVIRKPLIGVVAGLLSADPHWHDDVTTRRVATAATWLWLGMFCFRLSVQVPLYLTGAVSALALAKLVMGIPLYGAVLWLTWLLMRAVYRGRAVERG